MSKTKVISIGEHRYELRKFLPAIGSFILMKLLSGATTGVDSEGRPSEAPDTKEFSETDWEKFVRGIVISATARGLDLGTHELIQRTCLTFCSRLETTGDSTVPMPIVNSNGVISIPELRDDMQTVLKLEIESLVFNYASFFKHGGLNALAGEPPATA